MLLNDTTCISIYRYEDIAKLILWIKKGHDLWLDHALHYDGQSRWIFVGHPFPLVREHPSSFWRRVHEYLNPRLDHRLSTKICANSSGIIPRSSEEQMLEIVDNDSSLLIRAK